MNKIYILMLLFMATVTTDAFAQAAPSGSPEPSSTPKPVVKRRTFDQFDLSNGVTLGRPAAVPAGNGTAKFGAVEFVDERTYDNVRKLAEYVGAMDVDYRSAVLVPNFQSHHWELLSALGRKINATYRITDLLHDGLLDQTPLQNPMNVMLLEETQTTLREAGSVAAVSGGWSKDETMLAKMTAKYNAEETGGIENMRRAVLIAMFARLNTNFAQLLGQIAVKKQ